VNRHRRAIGIGAAAALLIFFIVHVAHWHWPHRLSGAVGELPLLGVAVGAGLVAALLLTRVVPLFRSLEAFASGALVALFAFLVVQAADPFVGARSWRYAPARCDLAVEFPRAPTVVSGEAVNDARQASPVERALLTDLGSSTSYSAECLALGRAIEPADRARLLADAEARLKRDAERLRIKIERLERDGEVADASGLVLHGLSDEGRNAANEPLLRRARARVVLGGSSVLVVWSWSVLREGEAAPAGVERFHASVRPAAQAAR
jgi:hypothetical protein